MIENRTRFKYTPEYQWDLLRYIVQSKDGERALKKIDDQYFIVDAGHYRILYSDDVKKADLPLEDVGHRFLQPAFAGRA